MGYHPMLEPDSLATGGLLDLLDYTLLKPEEPLESSTGPALVEDFIRARA